MIFLWFYVGVLVGVCVVWKRNVSEINVFNGIIGYFWLKVVWL